MSKFVNKSVLFKALLFIFVISALHGCTVSYSFTGINLHPNDKSVTVKYFKNRASLVNPMLSQTLTEGMKDRFLSQTNLELTDAGGDLIFEGEITGYKTAPVAIQSNQKAASIRLTVTVKVKYTSKNAPKNNFEESFSRYRDFESTKMLSDVEDNLTEEIVEELIDDIFNKSVVNW